MKYFQIDLPYKISPKENINISKDIFIGDASAEADRLDKQDVILSSSQERKEQKPKKPRKNSPKEKSRRLFRTVYRRVRQTNEPPEKFIKFTSNEQLDTVFEKLWVKYPRFDIYDRLYDEIEKRGLLGSFDYCPSLCTEQVDLAAKMIEEDRIEKEASDAADPQSLIDEIPF